MRRGASTQKGRRRASLAVTAVVVKLAHSKEKYIYIEGKNKEGEEGEGRKEEPSAGNGMQREVTQ